jgi:hypothetical protein
MKEESDSSISVERKTPFDEVSTPLAFTLIPASFTFRPGVIVPALNFAMTYSR